MIIVRLSILKLVSVKLSSSHLASFIGPLVWDTVDRKLEIEEISFNTLWGPSTELIWFNLSELNVEFSQSEYDNNDDLDARPLDLVGA